MFKKVAINESTSDDGNTEQRMKLGSMILSSSKLITEKKEQSDVERMINMMAEKVQNGEELPANHEAVLLQQRKKKDADVGSVSKFAPVLEWYKTEMVYLLIRKYN